MNAKTLYISDLDGTLLNSSAELSIGTTDVLNRLIQSGVCFSFATARTPTTAFRLFDRISLNTPFVLMNGVVVYDPISKHYIKKENLTRATVTSVIDVMHEMEMTGVFYGLNGETLFAYYERIGNSAQQAFFDERRTKYNKVFTQVSDLSEVADEIVYIMFLDTTADIERLYQKISSIPNFNYAKYQDTYYTDTSFMEIFSTSASKYRAINFLKDCYGFERVVGFGDNLNDIPLFEACDESYAVANAKDEVKAIATGIIGSNDEDGVADWLLAHI